LLHQSMEVQATSSAMTGTPSENFACGRKLNATRSYRPALRSSREDGNSQSRPRWLTTSASSPRHVRPRIRTRSRLAKTIHGAAPCASAVPRKMNGLKLSNVPRSARLTDPPLGAVHVDIGKGVEVGGSAGSPSTVNACRGCTGAISLSHHARRQKHERKQRTTQIARSIPASISGPEGVAARLVGGNRRMIKSRRMAGQQRLVAH